MIGITFSPGVQEETTCAKDLQMEMLRKIIITHKNSLGFSWFPSIFRERQIRIGRWPLASRNSQQSAGRLQGEASQARCRGLAKM